MFVGFSSTCFHDVFIIRSFLVTTFRFFTALHCKGQAQQSSKYLQIFTKTLDDINSFGDFDIGVVFRTTCKNVTLLSTS